MLETKRVRGAALAALACALLSAAPARGAGISTSAGELLLTGLQIGQTYKLSTLAGFKLSCQNDSSYPMNIAMRVALPGGDLKTGFVSLPDASWIRLEQSQFEAVPSRTAVFTDVFFDIPASTEARGRSYQFYVEMEAGRAGQAPGSSQVAVGLKSRFLITIASKETAVAPGVAAGAYPFRLEPADVFLGMQAPGKVLSLGKDLNKALKLVNPNGVQLKVKLESLTPKQAETDGREGWADEPSPQFLTFSRNVVTVPAQGELKISPYLWIPDEPEQAGKRYMFVLKATSQETAIPFAAYSRIYVSTPEAGGKQKGEESRKDARPVK